MEIEHDVTEATLAVAQAAATRDLVAPGGRSRAIAAASAVAAAFATWGVMTLLDQPGPLGGPVIAVCAGAVAVVALLMLELWLARRAMYRRYYDACGPFPFRQSVAIDGAELTIRSRFGVGIVPLDRLRAIEDGPTHVVIVTRPGFAVAIPRDAFASDSQRNEFIYLVRQGAGVAA